MEYRSSTVWLRLLHEPLPIAEAVSFLQVPEAGGLSLFLGTTRRWTDQRETLSLFYEAYEAMALGEMRRLADEACRQWPVCRLCLWHRLDEVPVCEISVLVGVATPHRAEAFAACRFLIDTLKRQVPIWKRETLSDGQNIWVEEGIPEAKRR
ncbi:molybdenum cofactor biosynthesis protein MoaE [Rhodothermus profundi]|uniref:Molybdopterin synthase catalytic subunit n=1 Tax=Rhodothermus profundi TaxID=633813 RepID=A0A1M6SNY1_9BACT|nr:molybdenum cofactor biosynthesis protein MoaE [Rhodothermus profundi]SHK46329.1 molybdopterin synthase catalytic subunit [Rhodothermus profundi]